MSQVRVRGRATTGGPIARLPGSSLDGGHRRCGARSGSTGSILAHCDDDNHEPVPGPAGRRPARKSRMAFRWGQSGLSLVGHPSRRVVPAEGRGLRRAHGTCRRWSMSCAPTVISPMTAALGVASRAAPGLPAHNATGRASPRRSRRRSAPPEPRPKPGSRDERTSTAWPFAARSASAAPGPGAPWRYAVRRR